MVPMGRARGVVAAVALGMALAMIPNPPAHACSCAGVDPATQIELDIVDSEVAPADNPFGGDDSFGSTVDLRGGSVTVLGGDPALLEGLAIEDVPVLATVIDDPNVQDSCGTPPRPAVGSDIELTGTAMDEGDGPFIFAGPCSGTFQVIAGPDPGTEVARSSPGRGVLGTALIGVGAAGVLALVAGGALWQSRRDEA
jgi:hypothetical protein